MIRLEHITKTFPGVKSLDSVDFDAAPGEIHALVGENGAGKSTLIKVIAGACKQDSGIITYDGVERNWASPREAKEAGIHVIYQELVLFPELSVAENIFVGNMIGNRFGAVDRRQMHKKSNQILDRLGHGLNPQAKVGDLSVADQQMVEIAKSLVGKTKLLILDEPTAVISGREAELLFECISRLRDEGVCIVYISHRLEEIFQIANRVTVIKDGVLVDTSRTEELDRNQLVSMMVGRRLENIFPKKGKPSIETAPVLSARHIRMAPRVHDVSFDLHAGEILGLAGLVGAGRSELAHALFGSMRKDSGSIAIGARTVNFPSPAVAIERGMGFLTENRKGEGLLMLLHTAANISAPTMHEFSVGPLLDRSAEDKAARNEIKRFNIAVPGPHADIRTLSGGNQQKVLFARWSRSCRRVLILDEPTRGVDVGSKVEIYAIIKDLADAGTGILMISSELPELIGLCTRILVMCEGRLTGEVTGNDINETAIMHYATLGELAA